jgi:hypothetical protein
MKIAMRISLSFVCSIVILLAVSSSLSARTDPGISDTIYVDYATAYTSSGQGIVPVRFVNDEALSLIELTLTGWPSNVTIDSFSFVGGRVENAGIKTYILNPEASIITITAAPISNSISAGSGLLGQLYFSYSSTISPLSFQVDTTNWETQNQIFYSTNFFDTSFIQQDFVPQFVKGQLTIESDPVRNDSLWLSSTETAPGSEAVVDVFLYNENNISSVTLALDWDVDLIGLDSVSYVGTRGLSSSIKDQQTNPPNQILVELQYDNSSPLEPGSGLLARLYFKIDDTSPDTTITIDTTVFAFYKKTMIQLTSSGGNIQFAPKFHSGTIQVKSTTGVDDPQISLPAQFSLGQNYPNPFNPTTEFEYSLPVRSHVTIEVFDILGRNVRTLVNESMEAGVHHMTFDGRSSTGEQLSSGVYLYRISTSEFSKTKKMVILK